MKFKRIVLILGSVVFFLAAVTFYLNRVVFPQLIKNIVVDQAETTLKRKVDIGAIHFNWFKGFVVDDIKVYQKNSHDVLAEAQQISFGVIFIPGFKQHRITIPFIHVQAPSVHLVRTAEDLWNVSDIYAPSIPATTASKPSRFVIAWGGIAITNGELRVDDLSSGQSRTEIFDHINLKLSLSYKGISYDFTADIPHKKGYLGATVYYQPLTKNTQAQIHLKNIDTASYLSLINVPDFKLRSGIIKNIDLDINYTPHHMSVQGNVALHELDVSSQNQMFKGNVDLRGLNASYDNGSMAGKGIILISNAQTKIPDLQAAGNLQARVVHFKMDRDNMFFQGSLQATQASLELPNRKIAATNFSLDDIKLRKDKDGTQIVGGIAAHGLDVHWYKRSFQGNISLGPMIMRVKNENDISLESDLEADHFSMTVDEDKTVDGDQLKLEDMHLALANQQDVTLSARTSLNGFHISAGHGLQASGSVDFDKLFLKLAKDTLDVSTTATVTQGRLVLAGGKTINADPQLELTLHLPLADPAQMTYQGSMTVGEAHIAGFPRLPIQNIALDTDFQTNAATINALTFKIFRNTVRMNGTVKNFKAPVLDVEAEADEFSLATLQQVAPKIFEQYDLSVSGTGTLKATFKGSASDPLGGNLLAVLSVSDAGIASPKFDQSLKNITGILEATPNSLKWRNFTAVYLGQRYKLTGELNDFKRPAITASMDGKNVQLKLDMAKAGDTLNIKDLTGKYRGIGFSLNGRVDLAAASAPIFDFSAKSSFKMKDALGLLPAEQRKNIAALQPDGEIAVSAGLKGTGLDWKKWTINASISSPMVRLMNYKMDDIKATLDQQGGAIENATLDGKLYDGSVHAVGSVTLTDSAMPFDLALNINGTDLHKLKMDSPLKSEEINGKFYLTTLADGNLADIKDFHGKGSMAVREGFLAEFSFFKGILSILNQALHLGQVMITDVEANFIIDHQRISTDNLRLKGPTIVLLGQGWADFAQNCDLTLSVDLSSGIVPPIAQDVLRTLSIHIYDKLSNPKFSKKISVPQVINSILKNILQ